jgi:hypothetical protein
VDALRAATVGGDDRAPGGVLTATRIWQGQTPDGYAVLIERDDAERWVVTVASVSRSRNNSLEAALREAGGSAVSSRWASRVVAAIAASSTGPQRVMNSSRTDTA